jgi:matrixin
MRALAGALVATIVAASVSLASNVTLSGREGHPKDRFPLTVFVPTIGAASLDQAAQRAVRDWNLLMHDALGVAAFTTVASAAEASVVVTFERADPSRLMGETLLGADKDGMIELPVRIVVLEPTARGQTSPDVILFQVLAHELGHALGLIHVRDPRSLMCCVHGSVDFNDPASRDAYIEARRHPDVRTARAQLVQHYMRWWTGR